MFCCAIVTLIAVSTIPVALSYSYGVVSARLAGQSATNTYGYAVAILSDGSFAIAGQTAGSIGGQTNAGSNDFVLQKYDSSMTLQWTRMYGSTGSEVMYGMCTDSSNNIYMVGSTNSATLDGKTTLGNADAVIVKYNSAGTKQWTSRIGGTSNDLITNCCTDSSNVYVVGYTSSASFYGLTMSASLGSYWMKLNPSTGAVVTTILLNNDASTTNQPSSCAVGADGNIVVTGSVSSGAYFYGITSPGSSDATIQKVSTSGTKVWNQRTGGSNSDSMSDVAIDSSNNIYIVGSTTAGSTYYGTAYKGSSDIAVQKLSSTGTVVWSQLLGSTGSDSGVSIALDTTNSVLYITGSVRNTFYGVAASTSGNTFIAVLSMTDGSILYTNVLPSTATDYGRSIAFKDAENVYIVGSTTGSYGTATVSGTNDMAFLKVATVTQSPTLSPTLAPTAPTVSPTRSPTRTPTISPTRVPTTAAPSRVPTDAPTAVPTTAAPSLTPSFAPTSAGSSAPSYSPSQVPTAAPSFLPTQSPTRVPSLLPTQTPSFLPSQVPTAAPSFLPTVAPTRSPTLSPSQTPTAVPTTAAPSFTPSLAPTLSPNAASQSPSFAPSEIPTVAPSFTPTQTPTAAPSFAPTLGPTAAPSLLPTAAPSQVPSATPTEMPSIVPTMIPTEVPSVMPTEIPSEVPSLMPTEVPSVMPTEIPSTVPTEMPTAVPTTEPTFVPSELPTEVPSAVPTESPTDSVADLVFASDTRSAGTLNAGEVVGIVIGSFVGGSILLCFFCIVVAAERSAGNEESENNKPADPTAPVVAQEVPLQKDGQGDVESATGAVVIIDQANVSL